LVWVHGFSLPLIDAAHAFQINLASAQLLLHLAEQRLGGAPTKAWLEAYLFRKKPITEATFAPRQRKLLAIPLHLLTTFSICGLMLLFVSSESFKQAGQALLTAPEAPKTTALSETTPTTPSFESQEDLEQETKPPPGQSFKKIKSSGSRWRFTLKTIHPAALKTRTEDILRQELKESIRGATVPGGIQFDLLVPTTQFNRIRERLMDLEEKPGHFTWIRMKPRQNPPKGMEILQIWLTQP
jgi:hypothetical protein